MKSTNRREFLKISSMGMGGILASGALIGMNESLAGSLPAYKKYKIHKSHKFVLQSALLLFLLSATFFCHKLAVILLVARQGRKSKVSALDMDLDQ